MAMVVPARISMVKPSKLQPWVVNPKDKMFSHPRVFGGTTDMLSGLPAAGMGRSPIQILDQGTTDFCCAYGNAGSGGFRLGIPMSPEYQVKAIGQLSGAPITNGSEPRQTMETPILTGLLPAALNEFTLGTYTPDFIANWKNWDPALDIQASKHKLGSYFQVDSHWYAPMDVFDSIRLALWQSKAENACVDAFGFWYNEWNQVGPDGIVPVQRTSPITLHRYYFLDFVTINGVQYLVAVLSQGQNFGKNGVLYFSREVVDAAWPNVFNDGTAIEVWRNLDPGVVLNMSLNKYILLQIMEEIASRVGSAIPDVEAALGNLFKNL